MAKTPIIDILTGKTEFTITPSSKSANYVYDNSLSDATDVTFTKDYDSKKYSDAENVMYREGDNLVILTKFKKNFTTKKTITSTLIDYFTNAKAGKVLGPYPFDKNGSAYTSKNKNYVYDSMLAVKTFEKESAKFDAIIGNSKNNTYNLKYTGGDRIYEDKGNETYNITHAYVDGESTTIYEYAGKDKYDISGGAKANILEYAGKDSYTIADSIGNIYEYAGNDTYKIEKMQRL